MLRSFLCFDVRFGTIIIACVELAYAVLGMIDSIQLTFTSDDDPSPTPSTKVVQVSKSASSRFLIIGDFGEIRKYMRMYAWVHMAETLGLLIIASMLVHGVRVKRRTMFVPWLGIHFLTTTLFAILTFVVPLAVLVEFGEDYAGVGATGGLAAFFAFVVNAYFTLLVYSHYRELGAEARARAFGPPVEIELHMPTTTVAEQMPPSYDDVVKKVPLQ
jgi:hypothetical protein